MIRTLVTGTLFGDPQVRTSQAGKPFTTAKLKADGKDGSAVWINLVAFGEIADLLAAMKERQAVAVSGRLEVSAYLNRLGEPAPNLSVVVDELVTLALKCKPKPPQTLVSEPAPASASVPHPAPASGEPPFDDWEEWERTVS